MIHAESDPGITNGFVSIETAERLRQQQTVATFREKYAGEYQRLVDACVGLKKAHQELEAAKRAAGELTTGFPISDLLDGCEREARALLKEAADRLTAQQLAQVNADVAIARPSEATPPVPVQAKKKAS
jgi:hypothetical protein